MGADATASLMYAMVGHRASAGEDRLGWLSAPLPRQGKGQTERVGLVCRLPRSARCVFRRFLTGSNSSQLASRAETPAYAG